MEMGMVVAILDVIADVLLPTDVRTDWVGLIGFGDVGKVRGMDLVGQGGGVWGRALVHKSASEELTATILEKSTVYLAIGAHALLTPRTSLPHHSPACPSTPTSSVHETVFFFPSIAHITHQGGAGVSHFELADLCLACTRCGWHCAASVGTKAGGGGGGLSVHVGVGCGRVSCFHVGSDRLGWQLVVSGGLFENQVRRAPGVAVTRFLGHLRLQVFTSAVRDGDIGFLSVCGVTS